MYTPLHLLADVCFQQAPLPTPSMPSSSAPPDHGNAVRFRELSLPPIITLNCARDNGNNRPADFSQRTTLIHLSDSNHVTEPPPNAPERSISTTTRTNGRKRKREAPAVLSAPPMPQPCQVPSAAAPPKNKRPKKMYDKSDRVLRSRKSEAPPQTESEETIPTPEQPGPSVSPSVDDVLTLTEPSGSESASSDVSTYLPFSGVLGYRRLNAPEDDPHVNPWTMTQEEVVAVINNFKDTQSWGKIRRPLVL